MPQSSSNDEPRRSIMLARSRGASFLNADAVAATLAANPAASSTPRSWWSEKPRSCSSRSKRHLDLSAGPRRTGKGLHRNTGPRLRRFQLRRPRLLLPDSRLHEATGGGGASRRHSAAPIPELPPVMTGTVTTRSAPCSAGPSGPRWTGRRRERPGQGRHQRFVRSAKAAAAPRSVGSPLPARASCSGSST